MLARTRLLLTLALLLASTLRLASASTPSAVLGVGDAAFFDGAAGTINLTLAEQGKELRVALDRRDYSPSFQLVSPTGQRFSPNGGWYGLEVFVSDPAPGAWKIEVSARASSAPYRLRARLSGPPAPSPVPAETRLPNLRMVPPFELTFSPPGIGPGFGLVPTPGSPVNCSAQEVAETSARRCLRFSTGPANDGSGPLAIRFAPLEGLVTTGTAYQLVYDSDGRSTERPAGTYEYHKTHLHYHHSGFGRLELFQVVDEETGTLLLVGEGPKQGFCTGDVVMFDWTGFSQPRQPVDSGCVDEAGSTGTTRPLGTTMALNTGWADLYSWIQDGMYVEWGANGDGLYVVRVTADSKGWVLEENETDNSSYALIRVTGTNIEVLERGLGRDPWDPSKTAVDDRLPPTA